MTKTLPGIFTLRCSPGLSHSPSHLKWEMSKLPWTASTRFSPLRGEILRQRGRSTIQFSKIAIPVLNQVVRPFTAKWHKESLAGAFDKPDGREEFRKELESLQEELRNYNRALAEIAGVEDLTDLEQSGGAR